MNKAIEKMRAFYAHKPDAPVVMEEFGFYTLDRWISEGHIKKGENLAKLFGYDGKGKQTLFLDHPDQPGLLVFQKEH